MLQENNPLTGQNGLYGSAAFDHKTSEIILKLVNTTNQVQLNNLVLDGANKLSSKGTVIVLKSEDLNRVNSLDQPTLVSPIEQEITIKGKNLNYKLEPYSFTIIKIKTAK